MKEKSRENCERLFLGGLLGSLGDLAGTLVSLDDGLDDTDSDGLTHVTDSETTERRVFSEGLNAPIEIRKKERKSVKQSRT